MRAIEGAIFARVASSAFSTKCSNSAMTLSSCLTVASHCFGSNLKVSLLSAGCFGCSPFILARLAEFQKTRCATNWPTEWFLPSDQAACSGVNSAVASLAETNQFFWLWVSRNCISRMLFSVGGCCCLAACCAKEVIAKSRSGHKVQFFIQILLCQCLSIGGSEL